MSEIVIKSDICRKAARNIYPDDPDELFNSAWLSIREREIRNPNWMPSEPVNYFLIVMRNHSFKLKQVGRTVSLTDQFQEIESPIPEVIDDKEDALNDWLATKSKDDNEKFLKNIVSLSIYCTDVDQICKLTEMSRVSFYKYRKIALNEFYEYYNRITASSSCVYDFMV
jgi:hypothetical protein